MKDCKKIKESKEKATNLQKQVTQLEEKVAELEKYCEGLNIENWDIWEKQSHTAIAYMWKIDTLKEDSKIQS